MHFVFTINGHLKDRRTLTGYVWGWRFTCKTRRGHLKLYHCQSFCIKVMSRFLTKPTKWHVRPAKTQISFGIRPVWSESSLSAWRKLGSLATQWTHSEDSDQTGRMPRLIWIFTGRTTVRMKKACVLSYPLSAQRRLWSDLADAQAYLSLRWVHMPFCWFCH